MRRYKMENNKIFGNWFWWLCVPYAVICLTVIALFGINIITELVMIGGAMSVGALSAILDNK